MPEDLLGNEPSSTPTSLGNGIVSSAREKKIETPFTTVQYEDQDG
jgi:hypothetical protein